ncbi:MAG: MaoC/PaaZ C-terminal domain-containing protein [bacterium]|nr:MaoC/PaaZ C-terminal domain-containing protein [bacterium]
MGLNRPILHGLATMGMTARAVAAAVGAHPASLSAAQARFANPVYPAARCILQPRSSETWRGSRCLSMRQP